MVSFDVAKNLRVPEPAHGLVAGSLENMIHINKKEVENEFNESTFTVERDNNRSSGARLRMNFIPHRVLFREISWRTLPFPG
jgi:hypothetical protein